MPTKLKTAYAALSAVSLAFFGVAFHKAWVYSCLPLLRGWYLGDIPLRTVFELLCAVAAFAFALAARRRHPRQLSRTLPPIAVACQSSAALLLVAHALIEGLPAFALWASAGLGAVGTIAMALLWANVYASLNPLRVALFYSGGIVIADFIAFAVQESGAGRIALVCAVLPFATLACLKRAEQRVAEERQGIAGPAAVRASDMRLLPWKVMLFVSAYAFAYGVSAHALPYGAVGLTVATAIPALVVFASVLLNTKGFNFEAIYQIAFPLMVLGFLAVAAIPGIDGTLSSTLVSISYIAIEMLVMLVVCALAYRTGMSAFWLFGIVKGCQYLSKFLGLMAMSAIRAHEAAAQVSAIAFVLVIALVVVASLLFASERTLFSRWGSGFGGAATGGANGAALGGMPLDGATPFGVSPASLVDSSTAADAPTPTPGTDANGQPLAHAGQPSALERIDGLATFYGLTQRETEVLMLLAQGKSVRGIGLDMFIAEGTVKAHIQHIYQKLDVHNRQELLNVIGAR